MVKHLGRRTFTTCLCSLCFTSRLFASPNKNVEKIFMCSASGDGIEPASNGVSFAEIDFLDMGLNTDVIGLIEPLYRSLLNIFSSNVITEFSLTSPLMSSNYHPYTDSVVIGVSDIEERGVIFFATVLAHEIGHWYQNRMIGDIEHLADFLVADMDGKRRLELHADFMAGVALAKMGSFRIPVYQDQNMEGENGPEDEEDLSVPQNNTWLDDMEGEIVGSLPTFQMERAPIFIRHSFEAPLEPFLLRIFLKDHSRVIGFPDFASAMIHWQMLGSEASVNSSHPNSADRLRALGMGYDFGRSIREIEECFTEAGEIYELSQLF